MKIDFNAGVSLYRKNTPDSTAAGKNTSAAEAAGKTDVLDFSHGAGALPDKSMLGLKAAIQRDVAYPSDPQRLEQLKADVRNKSYRVPTEALVDAVLGSR